MHTDLAPLKSRFVIHMNKAIWILVYASGKRDCISQRRGFFDRRSTICDADASPLFHDSEPEALRLILNTGAVGGRESSQ